MPLMLHVRALAAVTSHGALDADELRTWLPRLDELIFIAQDQRM